MVQADDHRLPCMGSPSKSKGVELGSRRGHTECACWVCLAESGGDPPPPQHCSNNRNRYKQGAAEESVGRTQKATRVASRLNAPYNDGSRYSR